MNNTTLWSADIMLGGRQCKIMYDPGLVIDEYNNWKTAGTIGKPASLNETTAVVRLCLYYYSIEAGELCDYDIIDIYKWLKEASEENLQDIKNKICLLTQQAMTQRLTQEASLICLMTLAKFSIPKPAYAMCDF